MAKQKEIKFRDRGGFMEGRRGNLVFTLDGDTKEADPEKMTYSVVVRHRDIESLGMSTAGHLHFRLEDAKEFCQKIAAGEIDPEELLAEFATEDMAKERAVFREITEKAKKFHARLDAMGLKYRDLLELEVLAHSLGDMGHNILLGYERGEGWPAAITTKTHEEQRTRKVRTRIYHGTTVQDEVGATLTFQPETLSLDPHSEGIADSAQTSGHSVPVSNLHQVQEQLLATYRKRLQAPHG